MAWSMPPQLQPVSAVTVACVIDAAHSQHVPLAAVVAIMAAENGQVGLVVVNRNGTYDLGPGQINSSWLSPLAQRRISESTIRNNGCVNVMATAWIFRQALVQTKGDVWAAIGRYHSRRGTLALGLPAQSLPALELAPECGRGCSQSEPQSPRRPPIASAMTSAAREEGLSAAEIGIMVVGTMLIGALGVVLYHRFRMPINRAWLCLMRVQVLAFCWVDGTEAQLLYRWAGRVSPGNLQWQQMLEAASIAGRWMRWVNIALLVPLAAIVWQCADRSRLFRRIFSARDLLARNVHLFPCIAPALRRNLLKEPLHEGPWATARSPTRFVADHGLLLDTLGKPVPREWLITPEGLPNEESPLQPRRGVAFASAGYRLDRDRARQLMADQLGERFAGLEPLPPHRKALAAALLAFAHGKRPQAQAFLDQLSISFREAKSTHEPFELDTAGTEVLLAKFPVTEAIQRKLRLHEAYAVTWMVALLQCARDRGGQLPSCESLWLRPADRTLWYALNQTGGRTPWNDASGVWAHYEAEEILGSSLQVPEVEAAVDALQRSLVTNGWLPEETVNEAKQGTSTARSAEFANPGGVG
jgi:intracellular multiplication protein IcmP